MAENKKSFLLYADMQGMVNKLPDEKAGELFKLILSYVNDENPDLDSIDFVLQIAFEPIKNSLKRDLEKYKNIVERNSINGSKGGRPKKPKKPSGLIGNPKKPKKADSDNDSVNDNESKEPFIGVVYFEKSKELDSAFKDYLKLRKVHKYTMTDRAINALVKKLRELSNGDIKAALTIIDNAILGKWKSFYTGDNK